MEIGASNSGANEQQPFPATTPTVAQQAKRRGYRTLFLGKWHLGCLYGECLDWELGPYNTTAAESKVGGWGTATESLGGNAGDRGFTPLRTHALEPGGGIGGVYRQKEHKGAEHRAAGVGRRAVMLLL